MSVGHGPLDARAFLQQGSRISAWLTADDPYLAGVLAKSGAPCVLMDWQHGVFSTTGLASCIKAIVSESVIAGVRLPVGRPDLGNWALDCGAGIVIAPMINDADAARALVQETRYPPVGNRSWGPAQALELSGQDGAAYLNQANQTNIVLAMIETVDALDNVASILAVDGLDGVLVGPSDLSISLSGGGFRDPEDGAVADALEIVLDAVERAQKISAIYATHPGHARELLDKGFDLVAVGSQEKIIAEGVRAYFSEL